MNADETIEFSNLDFYNSKDFRYTQGIPLKTTLASFAMSVPLRYYSWQIICLDAYFWTKSHTKLLQMYTVL